MCVIGSRNTGKADAERKGLRKFLNFCMMTIVQFVIGFKCSDSQCGFKIFSRNAAKRCFPTQHLERWSFDVELLFLCNSKDVKVSEMGVKWQDVDGSHLNVVEASLSIVRDMLLIKLLYFLRVWDCNDYYY